MPIPTLHKLGNSFDDRNMFLQVTLGVISLSRRLKDLLNRYGTPAADQKFPDADYAEDDDPFLYLVLGLVSCSQHLMWNSTATRSGPRRSRSRLRIELRPRVTPRQLLR